MDKIYRVFHLSSWGHEGDVKYFKKPKDAEKEFYSMVKKALKEFNVPKADDLDSNEGKPLTITDKPHVLYNNSKLFATVKYWEKTSYEYDEWDIDEFTIVYEEVEVA